MFANSYQSGFISIFYSVGSNPLALWDKQVKNGHIRRVLDDEVKSLVLEISGTNVATTYITCPIKPKVSLGIKLPFLVMVIKNMKKYFSFEIQILDDKDMHRRFRVSNFQSTTKVRPFCTTMPIGLSSGWNQVQFNLADFTKRAYGSTYLETMRIQVHANVRIRRIYFADMLYSDEEMPNEYKLFGPGQGAQKKGPPGKKEKEDIKPSKEKELKKPEETGEVPSGALPTPAGGSIINVEQEPGIEEIETGGVDLTQEEPSESETAEKGTESPEGGLTDIETDAEAEVVVVAEEGTDAPPTEEGAVPVEEPKPEEGEITAPEEAAAAPEGEIPPTEAEAPFVKAEATVTEAAPPEEVAPPAEESVPPETPAPEPEASAGPPEEPPPAE